MKLVRIWKLTGTMLCKTGLAIKGENSNISIGGADSEVVKNPLTNEPYIPGSSLKGKMRSQMERRYGMKDRKNNIISDKPCGCGATDCSICTLFGAHMNPGAASAPTRLIVRDGFMTEESRKLIQNMPLENGSYMEVKAENLIKRNTGTAEAPRFMERVPAGISFQVEIVLQVFKHDEDKEEKLKAFVEEALKAVESSYLGGSGSRGYGQVEFAYVWEKEEW